MAGFLDRWQYGVMTAWYMAMGPRRRKMGGAVPGRVRGDAGISGRDRVLQLFHCDGSFGYTAEGYMGAHRRKGEALNQLI